MKMSLCQIIAIVCMLVVGFMTVTPFVPLTEAGWDRASSHVVTVDVYDMFDNYCGSYGYGYYVPDTTTTHYKYYHRGPTTPDTHPHPHLGTITSTHWHITSRDLDTLCDGTYPMYASGSSTSS